MGRSKTLLPLSLPRSIFGKVNSSSRLNQIWSDELNVPEMMNVLLVCYFTLVGVLVYGMHRWERAIRVPGFGV